MIKEDLRNIAIHCPTKEEADACFALAGKQGLLWNYSDDLKHKTHWESFKENTCYNFPSGAFAPIKYFNHFGYTVKDAQWFLKNFTKDK